MHPSSPRAEKSFAPGPGLPYIIERGYLYGDTRWAAPPMEPGDFAARIPPPGNWSSSYRCAPPAVSDPCRGVGWVEFPLLPDLWAAALESSEARVSIGNSTHHDAMMMLCDTFHPARSKPSASTALKGGERRRQANGSQKGPEPSLCGRYAAHAAAASPDDFDVIVLNREVREDRRAHMERELARMVWPSLGRDGSPHPGLHSVLRPPAYDDYSMHHDVGTATTSLRPMRLLGPGSAAAMVSRQCQSSARMLHDTRLVS